MKVKIALHLTRIVAVILITVFFYAGILAGQTNMEERRQEYTNE